MTKARAVSLLLLLAGCSGTLPPDAASSAVAPSPTPDPARPLPLPLPDVVARVNGQDIRIRQILPLAKAALDKVSVAERDKRKPEVIRQALENYVNRELLLQEALGRAISANTRDVEWSYDQMRREHAGDEWADFLTGQGMDPQSFKAELRIQHTVAALLSQELQSWPVPEEEARAAYAANALGFGGPGATQAPSFESVRAEVEAAVRRYKSDEIQAALLARLRARAKIELFL